MYHTLITTSCVIHSLPLHVPYTRYTFLCHASITRSHIKKAPNHSYPGSSSEDPMVKLSLDAFPLFAFASAGSLPPPHLPRASKRRAAAFLSLPLSAASKWYKKRWHSVCRTPLRQSPPPFPHLPRVSRRRATE